jgi:predicted amidophosphoribosyltransferase
MAPCGGKEGRVSSNSRAGGGYAAQLACGLRRAARALVHLAYPPRCLACPALVADDGALCPDCWRSVAFVDGLACDSCGIALPGMADEGPVQCDDCLTVARPWGRGRAAFMYGGAGRRMVLARKHRDAQHLAAPAGRWLGRAAAGLIRPDTLIAPVPLHRWRLFRRRFNQSALLAAALARAVDRPHCPDLLVRHRATGSQDGRSRDGRFANLQGAIAAHPRRAGLIAGRHVLLVDDVMTSGATLAAAADAARAAGAREVSMLVLARVARDP